MTTPPSERPSVAAGIGDTSADWLRLLEACVESARDCLLILEAPDDQHVAGIRYANPAWCRMTGYDVTEVRNNDPALFVPADDAATWREEIYQAWRTGNAKAGTRPILSRDGIALTVDWRLAPLIEPDGRVEFLTMVQRDVSERERLAASVEYHAAQDPLTGLWQRSRMQALIEAEAERGDRHGVPWSLVLLDIDGLTGINDEHGFAVGDHVLRNVARLLVSRLRRTDTCGRWGSDTFLVLLPHTPLQGAIEYARNIDRLIASADNQPCPVSVSSGVAEHIPGEPVDTAIEAATNALRTAKRGGTRRLVPAFGRYGAG